MKLFLLGHAGGSPGTYVPRLASLARRLELIPLDLPGHGRRIDEPLLETVPDMVADLRHQLRPFFQGKGECYALFGHSMGGLLAFALQLSLAAERRYPLAEHLFVSSTCFPGRHHIPAELPHLADRELWFKSAAYFSGISQEVAASSELMALFAPILRADLKAVLAWSPREIEPVPVPLTVMAGKADIVNRKDLEFWRNYTTRSFSAHLLPGNHFHLLDNPRAVAALVLSSLPTLKDSLGNPLFP